MQWIFGVWTDYPCRWSGIAGTGVFNPLFYYIPDAALAAVIIMALRDLVDFSMLKHLWIINSEYL